MTEGFKVVPGTLRKTAGTFDTAADHWSDAKKVVAAATLEPTALGLLGELSHFVPLYNQTVEKAAQILLDGENRLRDGSKGLGVVASAYADKDAEYYEKFGYLKKEI